VGPLGLPGIALAIAIAAWVEALVLLAILAGRVEGIGLVDLGRVAGQAMVGTLIGGALAFGATSLLEGAAGPQPGRLAVILIGLVVGAIFAAAYATVSVVLRIPELASIVEVMVDLVRRPLRS
jgi:peptidoglycan biosynthesis protein MviN/MurJ (putative lipid II flippase)